MNRYFAVIAGAILMSAVTGRGDEPAGTWRFSEGAEFPGASGRLETESDHVTLHYDFTNGGNYVAAYCDLATPQHLQQLRFRLRKSPSATITVRVVDSAGQCFQKSLYFDDAREREIAVNMRGWSGHWGGPNDGVMRPPMQSVGILVERQGLDVERGSISVANLHWETAPESERADFQAVPQPAPRSYLVTDFGSDCALARSAGKSLSDGVWHVDFSARRGAALNGSLSLFHRPTNLSIRLQASEPGAILTVQIGAHFQNFRRTISVLDGTEQSITFSLPPEGWEASGAAHETLHYPLRITRIELQRGECRSEQLEVRLDSIRCETTVDPSAGAVLMSRLEAAPPAEGRRPFTLACHAWNLLENDLHGTVRVQVMNWDGSVLHAVELPTDIPGGGKQHRLEYTFSVPEELRYVETRCVFACTGQQDAEASSTFTASLTEPTYREQLPAPDPNLCPQSPWGMGVYLYRYPHSPEGLAAMDQAAALAAKAGVKWTREEFNYGMIEKAPGVYDFSFFDSLVETARRHGISVYALLSYWSPFVEPYTEEGIAAYCEYARATVRRYKDQIKHWEIYNEPNIFFWNGPKELYPVLLKRVHAVIKEEDPTARVLGISTAGIDRSFIRMVLAAEAPFDDLTIHPYRGQLIERSFIRELQDTAELVDDRPVWITEMGWSTQIDGGKSEREQAQLLARAYLAAVGAGVRNMGWYNFRNDGDDPFYNEANFGVLRRDLTPKAAYRALATVCRSLAVTGSQLPRWMEHGDGQQGLYALACEDNAAIWSPHDDMEVTITVSDFRPNVLNLMGELCDLTPVPTGTDDSGTRYVVTLRRGDPVFLLGGKFQIVSAHAASRVESDEEILQF